VRADCYEVLGVAPGAATAEIKAAYRDLAKVWHPDRFAHDPRLQQKAQEKLKEINEAYRRLLAGETAPPRREPHTPDGDRDEPKEAAGGRRKFDPRLIVTALVFCATFAAVTPRLLSSLRATTPGDEAATRAAAQTTDGQAQAGGAPGSRPQSPAGGSQALGAQTQARAQKPADGATRADSRIAPAVASQASVRAPLPTASVTVDPSTNLLARGDCPHKLRVTFPAGEEPRAYCDAAHGRAEPAAAREKAQDKSRLKSFAGRIASPSKWLGGGEKKPDAPRQSP
jgi:hypothetical protein